jgi:hypothetical protein
MTTLEDTIFERGDNELNRIVSEWMGTELDDYINDTYRGLELAARLRNDHGIRLGYGLGLEVPTDTFVKLKTFLNDPRMAIGYRFFYRRYLRIAVYFARTENEKSDE